MGNGKPIQTPAFAGTWATRFTANTSPRIRTNFFIAYSDDEQIWMLVTCYQRERTGKRVGVRAFRRDGVGRKGAVNEVGSRMRLGRCEPMGPMGLMRLMRLTHRSHGSHKSHRFAAPSASPSSHAPPIPRRSRSFPLVDGVLAR